MIDDIINKIILIQNSYHPFPHLETELEIINQLLEQRNKVIYVKCTRNILSCFCNPSNNFFSCQNCISRVDNGLDLLKSNKHFDNLHVITYDDSTKLVLCDFIMDNNICDIESLKMFHYKGYDLGLAAFSSLVSYIRDHEPDLNQYRNMINKLLISGKFIFDFFNDYFSKNPIDYVFLFNGRFNENRPLLRLCQNNNINYFTHERSGTLNKYSLQYNNIPHSIESGIKEINRLWNTADSSRNIIAHSFFNKRIHSIEESWYSFTKHHIRGLLPNNFNKNSLNIVIFNSSLDEYEGLVGFGPRFYLNDNEAIKTICESLSSEKGINLYLRVHPNLTNLHNTQTNFINNSLSKCSNLSIIKAEEKIDTYYLMLQSDIIITFGSTIGIEAAYNKKIVFLLGRSFYENLNCVYIPTSHLDLISKILNFHNNDLQLDFTEALKYGYWQEMKGVTYEKCKPISISKGYFNGLFIRSNWFIFILYKISNQFIKIKKYLTKK